MLKPSKGVHRLSLLLGSIGAVWSLVRDLWSIRSETLVDPIFWRVHLVIAVICFLIPWAVVHGVAWVIRGFTKK